MMHISKASWSSKRGEIGVSLGCNRTCCSIFFYFFLLLRGLAESIMTFIISLF